MNNWNISPHNPIVLVEFVLIVLATLCFIGGVFAYLVFGSIPVWNWLAFSLFILAKNWLEFFDSCEDRRCHNLINDEKLPYMFRRQAD